MGDIYKNHKLVPTPEEGVALALKSGTDLACGTEYQNLLPALRKGLVAESDIDRSLRRLLLARFKLGMFDPPEMVKWTRDPVIARTTARRIASWRSRRPTNPLSC